MWVSDCLPWIEARHIAGDHLLLLWMFELRTQVRRDVDFQKVIPVCCWVFKDWPHDEAHQYFHIFCAIFDNHKQ